MNRPIAEIQAELEAAREELRAKRRQDRRARQEAESLKREEFRADLEKEHDVHRLPKVAQDALWNMAWDRGHSSGWDEVRHEYEELVTLVDLVFNATQKATQ